MPKLTCLRITGVLSFAHLLTGSCVAQVAAAGGIPPGVEVRIQADPQKATIGDPIRIDLDVVLPKGYEVRLPQLGTQEGDFSILEVLPGPVVPEPAPAPVRKPVGTTGAQGQSGAPHHRARIIVAVYKTGEVTFPPLQLTLRDPAGKETPLTTPPVRVQIQSVLPEKDQHLNDLKKQAEIPEPSRWLLWLSLGFLGLLLAAFGWWLYRRRRRASATPISGPHLDPLQLAEAELRDLVGRGLLEKRMIKQFYVALSDIVKRILEAGYDTAAVERTTDEILDALHLENSPSVPRDELEFIAGFLGACDLVKFAKSTPSQAENEDAVKSAYRVLSLCKNRRAARMAPVATHSGGGA